MAREIKTTVKRKKTVASVSLPFTKRNYMILGAAFVVMALGYVALAQEPWNGEMPLVVAPILLLLGYCVLVPAAILYRAKPAEAPAAADDAAAQQS